MRLIHEFLEATGEFESPQTYFYWSFLAAVAGVVNNHVYLERYAYQLQPNIYVLLFGESGLRKGVPVAFAKSFVTAVNDTRIISGRISVQAMIQELGKVYNREGKPSITDAIGFVSASEFASSLVDDDQALTILTDLYDGHYNPEWKNTLKSTGTDKLKNVNLTIFGGINAPHFRDTVSLSNIQGGFVGRTFMIYETELNCVNSLVNPPTHCKRDIEAHFIPYFHQMAALSGEMLWGAEARGLFDEWYKALAALKIKDKTGTIRRLGDHVLKVAMLLAVSERRLEITYEDIELAMDSCASFSANANRVTDGAETGKDSPMAPVIKGIADLLYSTADKTMSRTLIVRQMVQRMGKLSAEIDLCLGTLVEMGFLQTVRRQHDVYYMMDESGQAAYEGIFLGDRTLLSIVKN